MSRIPGEFAPATELGPAYHRCDPTEPLRDEALDYWHVDLCEERGVRDFVKRLVRRISAAGGQERSPGGRPYEHVLLSGHTGSGKSTELQRLRVELEKMGYCVVLAEVVTSVARQRLDMEAIVLVAMGEVVEQLGARGIHIPAAELENIEEWFVKKVHEETRARVTEGRVEAEAGAGLKWPFFSVALRGLGIVKDSLRDVETRQSEYRQYIDELAEHMEALLNRARLAVKDAEPGCRGLVLIIDDMDKIDVISHRDEVFTNFRYLLARLPVHAIYTAPIEVLCSSERDGLDRDFGEPVLLPCVDLERCGALQKMAEVILRRCHPALFDQGVVDYLCEKSGGDVRNLLRLARTALSAPASPPVRMGDAEDAFYGAAKGFQSWLTKDHYDALALHDRDDTLTPNDEIGRELLKGGAVLNYSNHFDKYRVNPAVQVLPQFEAALNRTSEESA